MNYKEFIEKFEAHLKSLLFQEQLILALQICKKLFHDYQVFSQKEKWGDSKVLLDSIDIIELSLKSKVDVKVLKNALYSLESVTPDTEDFENASYALNACTAIAESLTFLIDRDWEHIFSTGTFLTDTVDFKIQELGNLSELEIDGHPDMIEARQFLLTAPK